MQRVEIHPTAHVHPGGRLGSGVRIGAYSIVGEHVELGDGTVIGSHTEIGALDVHSSKKKADHSGCLIKIGAATRIGTRVVMVGPIDIGSDCRVAHGAILRGPLTVGEGSLLFDQCVIGNPGQYPGKTESPGRVVIGRNVTIREFVAINRPILTHTTMIGDDSYLMSRTQVDHDCVLGCSVRTSCGVTLGGSVRVDDGANLGMNAVVHQEMRIGTCAMIGMNGVVTKNVPPYALLIDRRFTKINRRGLQLRGASIADMAAIEAAYRTPSPGTTAIAIDNPWLHEVFKFYEEIGAAPSVPASFGT